MIVSISQPRYLPFAAYLHRILVSDLFVYLDNVQYTPRDWENRNKVRTAQGWTWLTVPVRAEYRAGLPEVGIDNEQPWQARHWRTLECSYSRAPHYDATAERLRPIYEARRWERLVDLDVAVVEELCGAFGIANTPIARASEIGASGTGSELLLNLCKAVGASTYLSGPLGRGYLDERAFNDAGIAVAFHDYRHPVYRQLHGDFLPGMAAVDLLCNCGPQSLDVLARDQPAIVT